MSTWREISRFNSSGKTFFFNEADTKRGETYLQINALSRNKSGETVRERLSVFDVHLVPFYMKLKQALEHLVGTQLEGKDPDVLSSHSCIECGASKKHWDVGFKRELPGLWVVFCTKCNKILVESSAGITERLMKEAGILEHSHPSIATDA